jgi:hypothetical protein
VETGFAGFEPAEALRVARTLLERAAGIEVWKSRQALRRLLHRLEAVRQKG